MSSYSFTDAAVKDLEEICDYIARQNSQGASQFSMPSGKNVN